VHTLNLLTYDVSRKIFYAEGWVPTGEMARLRQALRRASLSAGGDTMPIINELTTEDAPPTFLRTNKFTSGFQGLVNTYGVPRYREVNPGAFAVILFPFLFGIMFGDVGHGLLLLLLAVYFIANEKTLGSQKLDDILGMTYGGRYVLLLNGIFAIYVGFIYNEAFSVPLGLFNSTWHVVEPPHGGAHNAPPTVVWDGTVYPFGVDPMWHKAENKMTFFNSFKMKVSIIFGVAQMTLGICLQVFNHLRINDRRSIYFGFVPEITFFLLIFGYLVVMIFRKWSVDWGSESKQPPSLLNTLISMFMAPGVYTEEDRLYAGQEYVQLLLVLVAVLAVPMLLLPKPILFYLDMKAKAAEQEAAHTALPLEQALEGGSYVELVGSSTVAPAASGEQGGDAAATPAAAAAPAAAVADEEEEGDEEGEFGEVVVHQVIHTIEFVLGSISNTASYLRLWALSLAHSQLSELFYDKVMVEQAYPAAKLPTPFNGIAIMFLFGMWIILNLGVLMVMENLSSFLHALRLQWVEFQGKFYKGDGYMFKPLSFAALGTEGDGD